MQEWPVVEDQGYGIILKHAEPDVQIAFAMMDGHLYFCAEIDAIRDLSDANTIDLLRHNIEQQEENARSFLAAYWDLMHFWTNFEMYEEAGLCDFTDELFNELLSYSQDAVENPLCPSQLKAWLKDQGLPFLEEVLYEYEDQLSLPAGRIYLFEYDQLYKIGFTTQDVKIRKKSVAGELGVSVTDVTIIHYFECDNARQQEFELHHLFAEKRVKGEWFALTENDVTWFKTLQ